MGSTQGWTEGIILSALDQVSAPSRQSLSGFMLCLREQLVRLEGMMILVLPLQPCPPELSTLVSGPWRNPLFRLKPNLTISSFPFCWLLSHLTGRLRSDFPILGSSFLKVDGGPQSVSSTPKPGFGLFSRLLLPSTLLPGATPRTPSAPAGEVPFMEFAWLLYHSP